MTRSRWAVAAVMGVCLLAYVGDARPHPEVDCVAAPYTAWSLVRRGSFDLRPYEAMRSHVGTNVRETADESWISIRAPGAALTAVPIIAPFALFRAEPFKSGTMDLLGKLSAALSVAGAAGLFFMVCRRLTPDVAWPATILFALGSSLCSVASQALWMHGPAAFWLCMALYILIVKKGESGAFLWSVAAGVAFGMAALCRPNVAIYGAATGLSYLLCRHWRAAGGLLLGVVPPMALLLGLNYWYFGSTLLGGYSGVENTEAPPLWEGLGGLLFSPSRGLFVYSPALLLLPLGVAALARRSDAPRPLLLAWGAGFAVTALLYARWREWHGGWSYGPRFFGESMSILALLFAYAFDVLRAAWSRSLARGLVALSVAIHLLGLYTYGGEYAAWHDRHIEHGDGRGLFAVRDTQIEAHLTCAWRHLSGARPPVPSPPHG